MLTSILFHLLGCAPREDGQQVSAHRCELPSLGGRLCLRDSPWQAGSFRQPNMTEQFGMAGRGKGIPAQGVPVLPLANSPVGHRWGIPHSPSLLKPAFQAAPPVAAGWWLPVMAVFSLPRVGDRCAAHKDQQLDARVTPLACISHGEGQPEPCTAQVGSTPQAGFEGPFLCRLLPEPPVPLSLPGSLCGAQLPSAEKTWNWVPSFHWRNWSLCRGFLGLACAGGLSTYPAVLGLRPLPWGLRTSGDLSCCLAQGKGSLCLSLMGNLV